MNLREDNFSELYDFVEFFGHKALGVDPVGNCHFEGLVRYRSSKEPFVGRTSILIVRNGFEDGKISLSEQSGLEAEQFHLDFSPDFQKYKFNKKSRSLRVSGSSDKMGGEYRVSITPVDSPSS